MIDNYDLWRMHDDAQEDWLEQRPTCHECGHKIQSDFYYCINNEVFCEDCMNENFRKDIEDFYE